MTYNKGSHYSERLKRRVKNFSDIKLDDYWIVDSYWNDKNKEIVDIENPKWYSYEDSIGIGCSGTCHYASVNSLRAFRRYVKKLNKYLPSGLKVRLRSNFVGIDDIILYTRKGK